MGLYVMKSLNFRRSLKTFEGNGENDAVRTFLPKMEAKFMNSAKKPLSGSSGDEYLHRHTLYTYMYVHRWLGSVVVRASDLWSTCHKFRFPAVRCRVTRPT